MDKLTNNEHLIRDEALSLGGVQSENLLIHADNNRAIRALGSTYQARIKCIYIDPPYNNQEKYNHYDDTDHHDDWLNSVVEHSKLLLPLLSEDGSIWVSIDDWQMHYLKVALDKVFGRKNFVSTIIWQHRKSRENRRIFSNNHEYLLVYARNLSLFKKVRNTLPLSADIVKRYKNPDNDERGPWQSVSANVQAGHATPNQFYEVIAPNGNRHSPPNGRCWTYNQERMEKEVADGRIWFGRDGNSVPRIKKFLSEAKAGLTPHTLWTADEVGTTESAKKELLRAFPDDLVFDTPKPVELVERIVKIASDEGDFVLDSYLGSGTTAVVAQRLGRKFIGIESGDQIISLCRERLAANRERLLTGTEGSPETGDGFAFCNLG